MKVNPKNHETWNRFYRLPMITKAIQYNDSLVRNDATRANLPEGCSWIDGGEGDAPGYAVVNTLNGPVKLEDCDWVIHGIEGDFYPCKEWAMPKLWRFVKGTKEKTESTNDLLQEVLEFLWDEYSVPNHPDGDPIPDRVAGNLYGKICDALVSDGEFPN